MFAAELGRSVGRWDFWKLRKEHTRFQWAVQQALYQVAPYGDKRDDMRAAVCTANQMMMHAASEVSDEEFRDTVNALRDYLPDASDYEELDDLEALKRLKGG